MVRGAAMDYQWVRDYVQRRFEEAFGLLGTEVGAVECDLRDEFGQEISELRKSINGLYVDKAFPAQAERRATLTQQIADLERTVRSLAEQLSAQSAELRALRSKPKLLKREEGSEIYRPSNGGGRLQ
jgi:hypothetical protein